MATARGASNDDKRRDWSHLFLRFIAGAAAGWGWLSRMASPAALASSFAATAASPRLELPPPLASPRAARAPGARTGMAGDGLNFPMEKGPGSSRLATQAAS
uniref:Uncharacterized protein n=1 Tax=Oryza rufipogon TaxID=4529 RepID=A0A0E0N4Y2_ORYRU